MEITALVLIVFAAAIYFLFFRKEAPSEAQSPSDPKGRIKSDPRNDELDG